LNTVWTVYFEISECKLYLLFISADAAKENKKGEKRSTACWCFKVCSPYSLVGVWWSLDIEGVN
jgi:hypothetical protein